MINNDDMQYSDADMVWKNQYPTKNDMGDGADTFRRHPFATNQQRCNVDDYMMAHTVFTATATAFADTEHYKRLYHFFL